MRSHHKKEALGKLLLAAGITAVSGLALPALAGAPPPGPVVSQKADSCTIENNGSCQGFTGFTKPATPAPITAPVTFGVTPASGSVAPGKQPPPPPPPAPAPAPTLGAFTLSASASSAVLHSSYTLSWSAPKLSNGTGSITYTPYWSETSGASGTLPTTTSRSLSDSVDSSATTITYYILAKADGVTEKSNSISVKITAPPTYSWVQQIVYQPGEMCHPSGGSGFNGGVGGSHLPTGTPPSECPYPTTPCGASNVNARDPAPAVKYACAQTTCLGGDYGVITGTYYLCQKKEN